MNPDEARLQEHLDQKPDDKSVRQVLADLLEEQGHDEEAAFQRWLAARGLWPDNDLAFCHQEGWHWWSSVNHPHRKRAHAVVPTDVQSWMPPGEWIFDTRSQAEASLCQALQKSRSTGLKE